MIILFIKCNFFIQQSINKIHSFFFQLSYLIFKIFSYSLSFKPLEFCFYEYFFYAFEIDLYIDESKRDELSL